MYVETSENQHVEFLGIFNTIVKMRFVPFKRAKTLTLDSVNMLYWRSESAPFFIGSKYL